MRHCISDPDIDLREYFQSKGINSLKNIALLGTREEQCDAWETVGAMIVCYLSNTFPGVSWSHIFGGNNDLCDEISASLYGNDALASSVRVLVIDFSTQNTKILDTVEEATPENTDIVSVFQADPAVQEEIERRGYTIHTIISD